MPWHRLVRSIKILHIYTCDYCYSLCSCQLSNEPSPSHSLVPCAVEAGSSRRQLPISALYLRANIQDVVQFALSHPYLKRSMEQSGLCETVHLWAGTSAIPPFAQRTICFAIRQVKLIIPARVVLLMYLLPIYILQNR